jgi:inner membrane organizing system protein 1
MSETSIPPPAPIARPGKPVSEALLNEKASFTSPSLLHYMSIARAAMLICEYQWDRCLSSLLIRSSLGLSFGIVFSVLLFKRRAWPAFIGLGFGAGRAYEECNSSFLRTNREILKGS